MRNLFCHIILLASVFASFGQGLVTELLSKHTTIRTPTCGSHHYLQEQDRRKPGILESNNQLLLDIAREPQLLHKKEEEILEIEVVFHILYNTQEQNIPDSVIHNQLALLNQIFRRQNRDTGDTRGIFSDYVGDAKIQFNLATTDPEGNATNGIVRSSTPIKNFGGTLPYGPNERDQIDQWVNDSFYLNLGRLSSTDEGGSDPWDQDKYLNIWVGDMRLFEPKFDDLEQLIFLGLATPPINHRNFYGNEEMEIIHNSLSDGVFMHTPIIGPNNPYKVESPYDAFNEIATSGKLLAHEVGHYLGLRHIWGDGDCDSDDFIDDTPKSNTSNQFTCNQSKNTCVDDINGKDLPDMTENYMDYSNEACMNAFTKGQIAVMREVVKLGRLNFVSTGKSTFSKINVYPNPALNNVVIESGNSERLLEYQLIDIQGKLVISGNLNNTYKDRINLSELEPGIYVVKIQTSNQYFQRKIILNTL